MRILDELLKRLFPQTMAWSRLSKAERRRVKALMLGAGAGAAMRPQPGEDKIVIHYEHVSDEEAK